MKSFDELYKALLTASLTKGADMNSHQWDSFDAHQLDCLLNPKKHPPVWVEGDCGCTDSPCKGACIFGAITKQPGAARAEIDPDRCTGCSECIAACQRDNLTASKDAIAAMRAVREHDGLVYALIAPAFHGQYSLDITPGMLRSAFGALGFDGMIEVALFADILTMKEALEFDHNIRSEGDYQLTSCCCPVWIAMIRKVYSQLERHIPATVSPMIASGRAVKKLHPDALTVFIGPCVAKKAEAREPDIAGAVDYVLTFQELRDVLEICGVDLGAMPDRQRDHSSRMGRIYARSKGVSEAVTQTVQKLNPDRSIKVRTHSADGVAACKKMLEALVAGDADANFFEGMACAGGCIGGPKRIIPVEEAYANIEAYGNSAIFHTPPENPYVSEMLKQFDIVTLEQLLGHSGIFSREF